MLQSRNPRFHSNGVLKLGRVSRSSRRGERNTQGGTTFCPPFLPAAPKNEPSPVSERNVGQTPVYNMGEKMGSNLQAKELQKSCLSQVSKRVMAPASGLIESLKKTYF